MCSLASCELAALVLDLVEQADVFDRDHRLVGEGLNELDLLVRERAHRGSRQRNRAEDVVLAHQRNNEDTLISADFSPLFRNRRTGPTGRDIGNVNGLTCAERTREAGVVISVEPAASHELIEFRREAKAGDKGIVIIHAAVDARAVRLAQSCRRCGQRVENRLQVEGRAADDLEHVGGGCLLLQRFRKVVGAPAQFAQQPRVLDGDHRLRGEVLHQLDLRVVERQYLLPVDRNRAYQAVFLDHRHEHQCPGTAKVRQCDEWRKSAGICVFVPDVGDVLKPLRACESAHRHVRTRIHHLIAGSLLDQRGGHVVKRRAAKAIAFGLPKHAEFGSADAGGIFQHGLEHRLQVARRA